MKRRDILKYTVLATGAAISAPLASTILSGCKLGNPSVSQDGELHFFSREEMELVMEVIDIIIPRTDSPSAMDVGVHGIIDSMVGLVYKPDEKESYRENFTSFSQYLNRDGDVKSLLLELEETTGDIPDNVKTAYKDLKQQAVAYYLSSEEIGTKFLNYLPVPGEYEPCISTEEVNYKAWAI